MYIRFLAAFINIVTGIVETLLGLRFILRFLGANQSTPFVEWIYENTAPLLRPFAGMFPSPAVNGQFVLEFNTVFAMILYALLSYFIVEVLLESLAVAQRRNK